MLSSILVVLLVISYFGYQRYEEYRRSGKKGHAAHAVQQQEEDIEPDRSIPAIRKARFELESAGNVDRVRVIVEGNSAVAGAVQYRYEWFRNGNPVSGNEDNVTGFKKGDKIEVKITPFDDKRYGRPRLLGLTIARVPPKIVENKTISFEGDVLSYQVKAFDPDGGALAYSLVDAPEGMTIDSTTGLIKWNVKTKDRSKYNVNVKIKNTGGAEAVYPLSLDIGEADG